MTKPLSHAERVEMLAEVARLATNVNFGHRAWAERQAEMAAGYPSRGGGGRGGGSADGGVNWDADRDDPAGRQAVAFDRRLRKIRDELQKLYEFQAEGSAPRGGTKTIGDPGCQSCERVVNRQTGRQHWSPTYATLTVEVDEWRGKRRQTTQVQWRLCYWCYRWCVPSGQGRVPTTDEVQAHVEGRRVVVRT